MRRYWIAPENLWVAARDGLDGMIIVNEEGKKRKISDDILNLMEHLAPIAKRLNCYEELSFLAEIIRQGSSAKRQRALFRRTQSLEAVVGALVNEFATGMPDLDDHEEVNVARLPRRPTADVTPLSTIALRHRARADLRRYH
jgi:gamma-glutamyl:cysteine ligase YbdK (ATP-grasp superfamily)